VNVEPSLKEKKGLINSARNGVDGLALTLKIVERRLSSTTPNEPRTRNSTMDGQPLERMEEVKRYPRKNIQRTIRPYFRKTYPTYPTYEGGTEVNWLKSKEERLVAPRKQLTRRFSLGFNY